MFSVPVHRGLWSFFYAQDLSSKKYLDLFNSLHCRFIGVFAIIVLLHDTI